MRKRAAGNGQFALEAGVAWAALTVADLLLQPSLLWPSPCGLPRAHRTARTISLFAPGVSGSPGGRGSVASA